jgi:hypothetical protein
MQFDHICNCPRCKKKVKFSVVPMQTSKLIKCFHCYSAFGVQVIESAVIYRTYPVADGNVAEPFRDSLKPAQKTAESKPKNFSLCNTCNNTNCNHPRLNIHQCPCYE